MLPPSLTQTGRQAGVGLLYDGGVNSFLPPEYISQQSGQVYWAENLVNRGGIWQTRPGFDSIMPVLSGNAQGFTIFKPSNSNPYFVYAVDGYVYVSRIVGTKYSTPRVLSGIKFRSSAKMVHFCATIQTVDRDSDGLLQNIEPRNILIMQDGFTRAAYWDGATSGHLNPEAGYVVSGGNATYFKGYNQTPMGEWMAWAGDRLWMSRGSTIMASDIGNPLEFTEQVQYGTYRTDEPVTGMTPMVGRVGASNFSLLVLTETKGWVFTAILTDRSLWAQTPDFQKLAFIGVGCSGGRSIVRHWGNIWWYSNHGVTNFDAAMATNNSSALNQQDNEMAVSKGNLSMNYMDGIAGFSFEQYFGFSVPSGDKYNKHTQVVDTAVVDFLASGPSMAWQGVWTGIRPIQWATYVIDNESRVFCLSKNADGTNHLWEAFSASRADNGCQIPCRLFTNAFGNQSLSDFKKFRYMEAFLTEMLGDVNLTAYYKGTRGGYHKILEKALVATVGNIGTAKAGLLTESTLLQGYTLQNRHVFSINLNENQKDKTCSVCGVEDPNFDSIDTTFSICLEWEGRCGLQSLRVHFDPDQDSGTRGRGACEKDEVGELNVNEVGCGV